MSYVAAVDHLHHLTQELSPTAPRRKFDLDHMRILATALGDPQKHFRSVLIAGTNGKGSTASTLASILAASGLRTAIYTSPHLSRVTERIRTAEPNLPPCHSERSEEPPHSSLRTSNLQPASLTEIPEEAFARLYFRVDETALRLVSAGQLPHHPSFFESLTALAFLYFAERKVDIAILEVGMGGRLDATNIVDPMLSVITDIALDHQDYLGNTIAEIAREKAGILRRDGTLITLPQHPEANQAIGEAAIALNVRGINAADYLPGRTASINSVILSEPPPNSVILSEPPPNSVILSQSPENSAILSEPPQNSVILSERSESKDPERLSPASPLPPLDHPAPEPVILTKSESPYFPSISPNTDPSHATADSVLLKGTASAVPSIPANDGRALQAAEKLPSSAFRSSSGLQPAGNGAGKNGALAPGPLFMAANHPFSAASLAPGVAVRPTPLHPNHYDLYLSSETLHVHSPLAGEHQRRNIALAISTAIELRNKYGYNITNSAIEAGIANTSWPGRLEFLPPNLLLDVAHNPAGAWTLRAAIATLPEPQPRTLIFSCLRDKDLTEMARILFPLFDSTGGRPRDHIVFAPIHNPRAASIDDLLHAAHALDIPAHPAQDAIEALALARTLTPDHGLIIATGSIYLIGALRDAVLGSGS